MPDPSQGASLWARICEDPKALVAMLAMAASVALSFFTIGINTALTFWNRHSDKQYDIELIFYKDLIMKNTFELLKLSGCSTSKFKSMLNNIRQLGTTDVAECRTIVENTINHIEPIHESAVLEYLSPIKGCMPGLGRQLGLEIEEYCNEVIDIYSGATSVLAHQERVVKLQKRLETANINFNQSIFKSVIGYRPKLGRPSDTFKK